MIFLTLYFEFFKTGLFSIGGGLATLPFLFELAGKYDWFTEAQLLDMIAVSESSPGPIGINMATFAGFNAAGPLGGVVATLGIVTPSIVIIILITKFLTQFSSNMYVKNVFKVLRPAVTGLIAAAGISVVISCLLIGEQGNRTVNLPAAIIFTVLLFLTIRFKKHPVFYLIISAAAGVVFKL